MIEKRKAGRPRHNPDEAKRVPLNMRTTPSLRTRLEGAAAETGRSLAQEVEARLEASFASEDQLRERFGGVELQALFQMLAGASRLVEARLGINPLNDFRGFLALREAWQGLLKSVGPAPDEQLAAKIHKSAENSQRATTSIAKRPEAPAPIGAGLLSGPSTKEEQEEHLEAMKRFQSDLDEYHAALGRAAKALNEEHGILRDLAKFEEVGREVSAQTLKKKYENQE